MKILFSIIAIILVTRGTALHGMLNGYAEITRLAYLRGKRLILAPLAITIITYFLATLSFGLEWNWRY